MATQKWIDGSPVTALDTGLNSLANSTAAWSSAIDNDTGLATFADIEVYVSGFGASINGSVKYADVYLVPTADGTNFADPGSGIPQPRYYVGSVTKGTATGSGAVRDVIRGVQLPPRDYKVVIVNSSGQAFAASSNTVKVRPYWIQVV